MDGPPHATNTMAVSERQRRRMCVLLASLCASVAHAQYPVRPVKIIVGLTAGGGVDVVSRIIAQKLGDSTGQSFVVDNRTGAGGNIAFELVAKWSLTATPCSTVRRASSPIRRCMRK